jgi:hypothetical protein
MVFAGQSGKAVVKNRRGSYPPGTEAVLRRRVFHVYRRAYTGTKSNQHLTALMCAYNYYCGGGDTVTAGRPRVKAGDVIMVHAGVYKYHPEFYTGDRKINATTPFEGTYYLTGAVRPTNRSSSKARAMEK